jgi:hypothetical protein
MAVATALKATMINAAFLQEVKDSHVELWDSVHQLRQMIEGSTCTASNARTLVSLLGQLRDQLAFEFSLEEAYGFIEGCRGIAPVVSQRAATAKQQHRELYLLIHELCEQAEEAQYRGVADRDFSELLAMAAEFDAQLRAHELLESELITNGFRG